VPRGQSGWARKFPPLPGFNLRIFHPVAAARKPKLRGPSKNRLNQAKMTKFFPSINIFRPVKPKLNKFYNPKLTDHPTESQLLHKSVYRPLKKMLAGPKQIILGSQTDIISALSSLERKTVHYVRDVCQFQYSYAHRKKYFSVESKGEFFFV
jgi:hypothetical protein